MDTKNIAGTDIEADRARAQELERQVAATAPLVGAPEALDWSQLTNPEDLAAKVNTYVEPGDERKRSNPLRIVRS